MDPRWRLKVAQATLTEGKQFPFVSGNARPQHHKGDEILTQVMIRNSYCGCLQHCRMGFQHVVDLPGSNVDSPFNDQFLGSADHEEVTVFVAVGEIAGV